MSPVSQLYYDGAQWRGRGGEVTTPDRDSLVLGSYIPDATTSGLLNGWTPADLTPVYPSGSNTYVSITGPGPYENKIFWGEIRMQSPVKPVFRNCVFAGKDPTNYGSYDGSGNFYGNLSGVIRCYGPTYYHFELIDCLIDPGLWMDPSVTRPGNAAPTDLTLWRRHLSASTAIHGGKVTLKRVEIKNVQDGINWVQAKASTNDPEFTLLEGCWIHKNVYYDYDDWVNTADGAHSDGFQFNIGSNLTIRGCKIGGTRDTVGYTSWPAYNSGDDAWNSEFMIKQEVNNDDLNRIENVLIEKNFIEGGFYGINHSYGADRPNMFTTTQIKDNYFVRRSDNKYVIRHANYTSRYSNNRIVDVNPDGTFAVGSSINYTNG